MKTLHRNKRKLYLCIMRVDGRIKKYSEPILLYENWRKNGAVATFGSSGMDSYDYIIVKTSIAHAGYYHLGDRAYILNKPPEVYDELCKTADYEVCLDPKPSINECEIVFKRISGKSNVSNF